jgi:segregation and condensation protein B
MMDMNGAGELARNAHAFLFAEGGSLSQKKLSQLLKIEPNELASVLDALSAQIKGSGVTLIRTETEVTLAVSPEASPALKEAQMRELGREVGDAGLEVLAIILYRGPSTRAEIDYIRGVNTSSTIRNLLMRGLIERAANPNDAREYVYSPTTELLAHIGIENVKDLPEYAKIMTELAAFKDQSSPFNNNAHGGTPDERDSDTTSFGTDDTQ